ncbi:GrlR family regulatory protein [Pseudomonas siliginis]|uniref:GrlR family regulatory protein n=1 Tax=Pseudomonas siliginis TaxID=2842346 RepID=UPI0020923863|nr:GrlR family regulatory protein [Pseudomonas siliginis]UST81475.1 hypothetical protein NF676_09175 [Pseudomonas siliginis]
MSNGIFAVEFRSNLPDNGTGVIVIKDGSVNGGDENFLYRGHVPTTSGRFSGQFQVSKWKDGTTSVTGFDNYTLEATGEINYESGEVSLNGSVAGHPGSRLELTGRKIADAF